MSAPVAAIPWLDALRARGAARFAEAGLPTQRDEAWKYTGLNRLKAFGFEPSAPPAVLPAPVAAPLLDGPAHRLVFVDGRFDASLSAIGPLPEGAILGSLAEILETAPSKLEADLGRLADIEKRPMVALNAAWIEDGVVLILPKGAVLDRPVEVSFVAAGDAPRANHPRHLIALGETAEAVLVERHLSGASGGFANAATEISLAAGSTLRHYALHAEPDLATGIATLVTRIGRDAQYRSFTLIAGGGLIRHEVEAALVGPGASCQLDGAYLVGGDRHAATAVLVDHQAPNCTSRQTQKSIVDDHGRAVFQGKILVRPDAQKTDGNQLSQTLLLSAGAEIDVKPELEIYADDVKCSHGATSGRLDADALFFLRARGIPEAQARALLIQGFIDGALDEIDQPAVRDAFKAAAANWLTHHVGQEGRS